MKTIGVDVQNSLSPLSASIPYSLRVFYTDTQTHIFINTKIHTYICTHIYTCMVLCTTSPMKKHAKIQKEKANNNQIVTARKFNGFGDKKICIS